MDNSESHSFVLVSVLHQLKKLGEVIQRQSLKTIPRNNRNIPEILEHQVSLYSFAKRPGETLKAFHNYWLQVTSMDTQLKALIMKSESIEDWHAHPEWTLIRQSWKSENHHLGDPQVCVLFSTPLQSCQTIWCCWTFWLSWSPVQLKW